MWHSTRQTLLVTRLDCFIQVNLFGLKPIHPHMIMMIGIWILLLSSMWECCLCCSLSDDISTAVSAAGGAWGSEHPRHNIRQEEQDPRVLLVVAQDKNSQNWRGWFAFFITFATCIVHAGFSITSKRPYLRPQKVLNMSKIWNLDVNKRSNIKKLTFILKMADVMLCSKSLQHPSEGDLFCYKNYHALRFTAP